MDDTTLRAHEHRKVSGLLRDCFNQGHLEAWKKAKDQGRCANNVSLHPSSNHCISTGQYTSFAAYRFAIKGRINTLPVHTVQRRTRTLRGSINCRKCKSQPETLAHALNHCRPLMGLIRECHNEVLQRLQRAVPRSLGEVFLEQEIPGDPEHNRPDLVVLNHTEKKAIIVDVTIPYEGESDALQAAQDAKMSKYNNLAAWLRSSFDHVHLDAFVVGALGSWDPKNLSALKTLKIGKNYSVLFRKLCASSAITGSHKIWTAFCGTGAG